MPWYIMVRDAITPGVLAIGPLTTKDEAAFYRINDARLSNTRSAVVIMEADGEDAAKQQAWPRLQG